MMKSPDWALDKEFATAFRMDVPRSVVDWPSMMTTSELSFLYFLSAKYFRGDGIIVDAGIFLGGSTHAFYSGLLRNKCSLPSGPLIQSYDIAVWAASMDRYLARPSVVRMLNGQVMRPGESFEGVLRRIVSPYASRVNLRIGDIVGLAHTRSPVEIAFYDCLKDARRDWAAFKAFAPNYIPGHTIILQQDYFYESAAIHRIRQELYSRYYDWIGRVGTTAVFRLRFPLPPHAFESDEVRDLPVEGRIRLLRQAALRADREKERLLVELSLLEHLIEIREVDAARAIANELAPQIQGADISVVTRRPSQVFSRLESQLEGR